MSSVRTIEQKVAILDARINLLERKLTEIMKLLADKLDLGE